MIAATRGCGAWSILDEGCDLQQWSPADIRLLGVQVSVLGPPRELIRAARWDSVIGLLAARWPELEAARELLVREG